MSDERAREESVTSEGERFDRYATDYATTINNERGMGLTGESFEYYLDLRLTMVRTLLAEETGRPPASIIDFGCGAGDTQVHLRRCFPDARLIGIDASAESVRVARERRLENVEFCVSDGLRFPVPDASVAVSYSNGTFHHVEHADHLEIARELYRVTEPGGHAFMFENNGLNPVVAWLMDHNEVDRGARRVSHWKLRRTFAKAGFRIRAVRFYAFFPKLLEPLRKRESAIGWLPFGAQYLVWGQKPRA